MGLSWFAGYICWCITQKLLTTTLLIPVVWLCCKLFPRRPTLQSHLWLIVLVNFAMPPLPLVSWTISDLPTDFMIALEAEALRANASAPEAIVEKPSLMAHASEALAQANLAEAENKPAMPRAFSVGLFDIVVFLWLSGSAIATVRVASLVLRKYLQLLHCPLAPDFLQSVAKDTARKMGVRHLTTVLMEGISSPFLCCFGRLRLAWPESLVDLKPNLVRLVVAHEAAHIRRGDHIAVWVELIAALMWWWNPLFWLVRWQWRQASEMSSDAIAIHKFPDKRALYAETLLWLSAHLKTGAPPLQLAIGRGAPSSLERRITMIASDGVSCKVSRRGILLAILLGVASMPGWSLAQSDPHLEVNPDAFVSGRRALVLEQSARAAQQGSGTASAESSVENHLLRLKAMYYIALAEKRAADVEALKAGIEALEASMAGKQSGTAITSMILPGTPSSDSLSSFSLALQSGSGLWNLYYNATPSTIYQLRGHDDLIVKVRTTGTSGGTIWGTDCYTDDSAISTAAVHAGLLKPEETGDVAIVIDVGQKSYSGSQRHGVSSQDWKEFAGSYRFANAAAASNAAYLCNRDSLGSHENVNLTLNMLADQAPLKPGTSIIVPLVGKSSGPVWGTHVYTADSSLDAAAVHAGFLEPGQPALCKVTILEGQGTYEGTNQNGIRSHSYGKWTMSFGIELFDGNNRYSR